MSSVELEITDLNEGPDLLTVLESKTSYRGSDVDTAVSINALSYGIDHGSIGFIVSNRVGSGHVFADSVWKRSIDTDAPHIPHEHRSRRNMPVIYVYALKTPFFFKSGRTELTTFFIWFYHQPVPNLIKSYKKKKINK